MRKFKILFPIPVVIVFAIVVYFGDIRYQNKLSKFNYVLYQDSIHGFVQTYKYERGWRMVELINGDSLLIVAQDQYGIDDGKLKVGDFIMKKSNNDTLFICTNNDTSYIQITDRAYPIIPN